jgi:hypothetical protein
MLRKNGRIFSYFFLAGIFSLSFYGALGRERLKIIHVQLILGNMKDDDLKAKHFVHLAFRILAKQVKRVLCCLVCC